VGGTTKKNNSRIGKTTTKERYGILFAPMWIIARNVAVEMV
jgi:hypothetical protein